MTILRLPLSDHLPQPGGETEVLLVGGDARMTATLAHAGYRVELHSLDKGPVAQRLGVLFQPPEISWPFADALFDAVILLDELALTVREEEALAEAARVLRSDGVLLLRVPATGPLAWLDGYNIYRYVWDTTGRGRHLQESVGTSWRRHYSRDDVRKLLRPHFRVRALTGAGIGLSEVVRTSLLLIWRWALGWQRGEGAIQRAAQMGTHLEEGWSIAGRGYWLVVAAERCRQS
jgi:SAM-dependent methyltransferase